MGVGKGYALAAKSAHGLCVLMWGYTHLATASMTPATCVCIDSKIAVSDAESNVTSAGSDGKDSLRTIKEDQQREYIIGCYALVTGVVLIKYWWRFFASTSFRHAITCRGRVRSSLCCYVLGPFALGVLWLIGLGVGTLVYAISEC